MRTLKIFIMLLIMVPLLMTGCKESSIKTSAQKDTEIQQLKTENDKLKDQLNSSLQSIQVLQKEQNTNKNVIDEENYRFAKEDVLWPEALYGCIP